MINDVSQDLEYAMHDVEHAFRLLEFSIRVLNYFELGKVDLHLFGLKTIIQLDEENVTFNDGYFSSDENAELTAKIAVSANFGTSAIVLDNLFEATGFNRTPASNDEFYLLWTLIYAVRNAFAHGVANPRWIIKGKYRREIEISIAGRNTVINLSALEGHEFDYSHIGGLAKWFQIKDRALTLVGS